jgi:hypothetical protein
MSKEGYLLMCEQLGNEPIPEEIPAEFSDFPDIIQQAMTIFSILPDRWEGMSGTYMGKDLGILPYLANLYDVADEVQLLNYILVIDRIITSSRHQKQEQTRKNKKK